MRNFNYHCEKCIWPEVNIWIRIQLLKKRILSYGGLLNLRRESYHYINNSLWLKRYIKVHTLSSNKHWTLRCIWSVKKLLYNIYNIMKRKKTTFRVFFHLNEYRQSTSIMWRNKACRCRVECLPILSSLK